jgi:hypothetical protein
VGIILWQVNFRFKFFSFADVFGKYLPFVIVCIAFCIGELANIALYLLRKKTVLTQEILEANRRVTLDETICVIPCHKAGPALEPVLERCVKIFAPERVWVADNANLPSPPDNTGDLAAKYGCSYVYFPLGNKTNAVFETVKIAVQRDPALKYVVLVDDDTILMPGFSVRADMFAADNRLAGYCPHIGINKKEEYDMWEDVIDCEYKSISWRNIVKGYYHTLRFLHGVCAVYRTDRMISIFENNPCLPGGLPFGEDAFAGVTARMKGWKLGQDETNIVYTFCPTNAFIGDRSQGFGASSLYRQRALRWYLGWPRRHMEETGLTFFYDAGSFFGNVLYRIDYVWYTIMCFLPSIWPIFLAGVVYAWSWEAVVLWFILHVLFYANSVICTTIRNFVMQEELKVGISTILLTPILSALTSFFYGISFMLALFWYVPFIRDQRKRIYPNWESGGVYTSTRTKLQ